MSVNKVFAEYVTSTAFVLTLSKVQCSMIAHLSTHAPDDFSFLNYRVHHMSTLQALARKGIVWWECDDKGNGIGFRGLTEAGKKVAELLLLAGLTEE